MKSQYNTGGRSSYLRINSRGIKVITHLHLTPTFASQGALISYPAYATVRVCTCAGTISLTESAIFWNMTPCSLAEVRRRFRRMYCLHLQGRKASNMLTALTSSHSAFLIGLSFESDDGSSIFLRNVRELPDYVKPQSRRQWPITVIIAISVIHGEVIFLIGIVKGWNPIGSTRHCGH
jgi:hypothetical protein